MEIWKEISKEFIAKDYYSIKLVNGEENGLNIELISRNHNYLLKFGVVLAVRMLDEGIVQKKIYDGDDVERFKKDNFQNVIYEVTGGEFREKIESVADGFLEAYNLKHYVIITQNYNIDIIAICEPEIVKLT